MGFLLVVTFFYFFPLFISVSYTSVAELVLLCVALKTRINNKPECFAGALSTSLHFTYMEIPAMMA